MNPLGRLVLKDGSKYTGKSFGKMAPVSGEVVFATGMVGYPESLTDPSYRGQILVMTYPLIGNYGVPAKKYWESNQIQVSGLVVSNYIDTPSHYQSEMSLSKWLKRQGVPALEIKDTRKLALDIRSKGVILGKMILGGKSVDFDDPNKRNLVAEVSTRRPRTLGRGKKTIALLDCGTKKNIERCLAARGVKVMVVPWDYPIFKKRKKVDGLVISNGPGDPKMAGVAVDTVRVALEKKIPTFGVCLGNQILTLAAGGNTKKMKFGHRGQNQPARLVGSKRTYLTTQNHGFVVSKVPKGFRPWFINANDGTNEGIVHNRLPFMSVQFHPEATPGPTDTEWLFDHFLKKIK